MKKTVVPGALVAVFGALTIFLGHALGLELDHVALLGVAIGAVVGLVPDRSNVERILGFLIGFVVAWIGYAIRAALLPDSAGGRALVVFLVLAVCMVIAFATMSRLPLWSFLLGAAAMVGSYESAYVESPPHFIDTSPTAATTILLAAAIGHLATMFLGPQIEQNRMRERSGEHTADPNASVDSNTQGPNSNTQGVSQ